MIARDFKTCSCGRSFTRAGWLALPFLGISSRDYGPEDHDARGADEETLHEHRLCPDPCGFPMSVTIGHSNAVLDLVSRALVEHGLLSDALRATQARCTALLEEKRRVWRPDPFVEVLSNYTAASAEGDLLRRLDEAGGIGLDGSPGDPLAREAAETIRMLVVALEGCRRRVHEKKDPPRTRTRTKEAAEGIVQLYADLRRAVRSLLETYPSSEDLKGWKELADASRALEEEGYDEEDVVEQDRWIFERATRAVQRGPRWTVSVYLIRKECVLLVKHTRLGMWLPIGGGIEPGERPGEAALREVQEETGLRIYIEDSVPTFDEHKADGRLHLNLAYRATVLGEGEPVSDGSWSEHMWLPIGVGHEPPESTPPNVRDVLSAIRLDRLRSMNGAELADTIMKKIVGDAEGLLRTREKNRELRCVRCGGEVREDDDCSVCFPWA